MTEAELNALRRSCSTVLPGHRQADIAEELADMVAWCTAGDADHDTYGSGELAGRFEQKIAALTGFAAGAFCITGTMAQSVALRLATMRCNNPLVALHASAHILKHENSNHQLLGHFQTVLIGDPNQIWRDSDLARIPDRLGAVLLELPMRELGGQMPGWDELEQIKAYCHERQIHLHLDGARLWEAQAAYGRPMADICRGFNSVYVSFYKGIGAMGGAMLLGDRAFVAEARAWMHRMGGRVFRYAPYVISAAMQFDRRLAAMPDYLARTRQITALLDRFPRLQRNPAQPQCNLFHLYLPVSAERAIQLRNEIAARHQVWLFNRANQAALPNQCYVEWYVGDLALHLDDATLLAALTLLDNALS